MELNMKNLEDPIAKNIVERFLTVDEKNDITEFHVHKSRIDENGFFILKDNSSLTITVEYNPQISEKNWKAILNLASDMEAEYDNTIIFNLEPDMVERSYGFILWKRGMKK